MGKFEIEDGVLKKYIVDENDTEKTIVIPEEVTEIGDYAFEHDDYSNDKTIVFPKGLKKIHSYSFEMLALYSWEEVDFDENYTISIFNVNISIPDFLKRYKEDWAGFEDWTDICDERLRELYDDICDDDECDVSFYDDDPPYDDDDIIDKGFDYYNYEVIYFMCDKFISEINRILAHDFKVDKRKNDTQFFAIKPKTVYKIIQNMLKEYPDDMSLKESLTEFAKKYPEVKK